MRKMVGSGKQGMRAWVCQLPTRRARPHANSSSAERLDNRHVKWEAEQDVRTDGHHDVGASTCAILAGLFIWALYLHYPAFGLANKTNMLQWVLGTVVAAVVFYYVARAIRRARGVRLELAYAEIPPE
jgi:hypothetical protein